MPYCTALNGSLRPDTCPDRCPATRTGVRIVKPCSRCGHRLGEHNAERPYAQDDAFECPGFKKVRDAKK